MDIDLVVLEFDQSNKRDRNHVFHLLILPWEMEYILILLHLEIPRIDIPLGLINNQITIWK